MKNRITLILFFTLSLSTTSAQAQMKVHFINVGQAEAILLEFQSAAVLIDAGTEETGDTRYRDHLVGYLDAFFDRRTDLNDTIYSIIVSHPHLDHTKAIMDVMNNFTVLNLVDGGNQSGSGINPLKAARKFARDHHILYNKIEDAEIGANGYQTYRLRQLSNAPSNVDVRFLAGSRAGACEDANNDSLVLRVKYGQKTFIFTGDSEIEDDRCFPQVDNLIDWYAATGLVDVDVYKVGHHGSHNGTSQAFMQAMTPEISVMSTGNKDTRTPGQFHAFQFGHPREAAFLLLQQFTTGTRPTKNVYAMSGAGNFGGQPVFRDITEAVYCTCWDGDIVISTDEQGTQLSTQVSGL